MSAPPTSLSSSSFTASFGSNAFGISHGGGAALSISFPEFTATPPPPPPLPPLPPFNFAERPMNTFTVASSSSPPSTNSISAPFGAHTDPSAEATAFGVGAFNFGSQQSAETATATADWASMEIAFAPRNVTLPIASTKPPHLLLSSAPTAETINNLFQQENSFGNVVSPDRVWPLTRPNALNIPHAVIITSTSNNGQSAVNASLQDLVYRMNNFSMEMNDVVITVRHATQSDLSNTETVLSSRVLDNVDPSSIPTQSSFNQSLSAHSAIGTEWMIEGSLCDAAARSLLRADLSHVRLNFTAVVTKSFDDDNDLMSIIKPSRQSQIADDRRRPISFSNWYHTGRDQGRIGDNNNRRKNWSLAVRVYDQELRQMGDDRRAELERLYRAAVTDYNEYIRTETGNQINEFLRHSNGRRPVGITVRDDTVTFTAKYKGVLPVVGHLYRSREAPLSLHQYYTSAKELVRFIVDTDQFDTNNIDLASLRQMFPGNNQCIPSDLINLTRPDGMPATPIRLETAVSQIVLLSTLLIKESLTFTCGQLQVNDDIDVDYQWTVPSAHPSYPIHYFNQYQAQVHRFTLKWGVDSVPPPILAFLQAETQQSATAVDGYYRLVCDGVIESQVNRHISLEALHPPTAVFPEVLDMLFRPINSALPRKSVPFRAHFAQFLPAIQWVGDHHAHNKIHTNFQYRVVVRILGQTCLVQGGHYPEGHATLTQQLDLFRSSPPIQKAIFTLHDFLTAAHCPHLLPLIPQIIKDELRITDVCIHFRDHHIDENNMDMTVNGEGVTGPQSTDRIILITGYHTDSRVKYTFVKIHQQSIFTALHFPQIIIQDDQTHLYHSDPPSDVISYVLLQTSLTGIKSEVLNSAMSFSLPDQPEETGSVQLLPKSLSFLSSPCNALLVVMQYQCSYLFPFTPDSLIRLNPPTPTLSASNNSNNNNERSRQRDYSRVLPWILYTAPTVVYDSLLPFLHFNDVIFGLRRVNSAAHNDPAFTGSSYWKKWIAQMWGRPYTECTEEKLMLWSQQLYDRIATRRIQLADDATADDVSFDIMSWRTWPLWYAVAVYAQSQLNKFRHKTMGFAVEQLQYDDNDNDNTQRIRRSHPSAYDIGVITSLYVGAIPIRYEVPSALRKYLIGKHPFGHREYQFSERYSFSFEPPSVTAREKAYKGIAWFAHYDADSHSQWAGLYLGPIFADENETNRVSGRSVNLAVADAKSTATENTRRIREYYVSDADMLPVVVYGAEMGEIRWSANTVAERIRMVKQKALDESGDPRELIFDTNEPHHDHTDLQVTSAVDGDFNIAKDLMNSHLGHIQELYFPYD